MSEALAIATEMDREGRAYRYEQERTREEIARETGERLVSFIRAHEIDARIADDGSILALGRFTYRDALTGEILTGEEWETIAPTATAVRDWLGY